MTLIDALYRDAELQPDHVAFIAGEAIWTNRRLVVETERLARGLVAHGVQRGDRVVLHMANVPEMALAYYACLRIGAIAVPMNLRLKTAELRPLLQRLKPALYLGQAYLYPLIEPIEATIIGAESRFIVGDVTGMQSAQPWARLLDTVDEVTIPRNTEVDAPAILLPTSGTTGPSKFVTHSMRTLSKIAEAFGQFQIDSKQVVINVVPMVHASGLFTLLSAVRLGAQSVIIERFDPDIVLDAIEKHDATWLVGLPFMYEGLLESQRARPRDLRSLRFCFSGGDVCPLPLQEKFPSVFGIPLYNLWAMSETLGLLIYSHRIGAVTRVGLGAEFCLVDDHGESVARGESGELLLRGSCIAIGYWKAPGEIDDPTVNGWFHTGDMMRQGDDDELWFVARKKDLLVRGGSNISPSEVEHVLMADSAVLDVAVVGVPDPVLGQRVMGLVQLVGRPKNAVLSDILARAKMRMADYKLPEHLVVVDAIPRNALGKIDRNRAFAMLKEARVE